MKADITYQNYPGGQYELLQVNGKTKEGKIRVTVYENKITVAGWSKRNQHLADKVQTFELV